MTPEQADWHERRRQGVGASEVAAVLGRSPWASPYSTWCRKVGLIPPDDASDAAQFGKDLEPITAAWFHRRTGLYVAGEQMMLTHPEHPWARATVDGLVYDGGPRTVDGYGANDALGVLELKFTGQSPWVELPEHHRLQVQWQLFVSGLERGWLAAFHTGFGRLRFQVYEVERDDELLAEIVPEVAQFWTGHVLAGCPPPLDGSDATTEALKAVHATPADPPTSCELTAGQAGAVELLASAKANRRDLDDVIADLENELRGALGENTEGRVGGFRVVSWKAQETRRIDAAKVRAKYGDTFDTVTTTRVLRLHKGAR